MGADIWIEYSTFFESPLDALRSVQQPYHLEYDLESQIEAELESARQGIKDTEEVDEYFLRDFHLFRLETIEQILEQGIPTELNKRLEIMQQIALWYSQGIGNILDILGIWKLDKNQVYTSRPLNSVELTHFFKNDKPTQEKIHKVLPAIADTLQRGESVCFMYFNDDDEQSHAGWCFIGLTID